MSETAAITVVRAYTLAASFCADHETAYAVRDALQLTAVCLVGEPTPAQANELFRIGAEAIFHAAEIERARAAA